MGQEDQSRKGRLILMPHRPEDGGLYSSSGQHHERVSSAEEFRKFLMAHAMLP
jgi:hypothetical protein